MAPFGIRLADRVRFVGNPLCVGLDPMPSRMPEGETLESFCLGVIDAVQDIVPVVKPQAAYFEAAGWRGVAALERVVAHARDVGLVVLLDAKRGDIGSTMEAYRTATVDPDGPLGADAVTLSPWLGPESLGAFLNSADRGVFVLLRTSNPGAERWQQPVADDLAAWIAAQNEAAESWGNVGAVVGATLGSDISKWRDALPKTWLLLPGVGTQGGSISDTRAAFDAHNLGALVVSARDVLYPSAGRDGPDWRTAIRSRALALSDRLAAP